MKLIAIDLEELTRFILNPPPSMQAKVEAEFGQLDKRQREDAAMFVGTNLLLFEEYIDGIREKAVMPERKFKAAVTQERKLVRIK